MNVLDSILVDGFLRSHSHTSCFGSRTVWHTTGNVCDIGGSTSAATVKAYGPLGGRALVTKHRGLAAVSAEAPS